MKKTCDKCRAYQSGGICMLGYVTEKLYYDGVGSIVFGAKPKEKCPKPVTINELINAKQKK